MRFSSIVASAIMAYSAMAAPAPIVGRDATSTAAATPTPKPLSFTAQLTLADTAADRFALLKDSDFVFNFHDEAKLNKGGKGGDLIPANRKTFPALVGTGAGMAVGFLKGCGFNTPHVHPRAVELQIVTSGRLMVEMVPENGVFINNNATLGRRVISNMVNTNEMTPFYQGSVHAQFNPDCTPATFVAAFNSEDFGAGQIADELFTMSPDIVSASFGLSVDASEVDKFRHMIPPSIAAGVDLCLKTCAGKI